MKTTLKRLSTLLVCAGLIAGCSSKPSVADPSAVPQDPEEKVVITIGANSGTG